MSNPKISFRRMKEEDKPSIFEISKKVPWSGDYLSSSLDAWSKDPDRLLVSMLYDGKVVGFHSMSYFDDRKTIFGESLRVHPDYYGIGVYKEYKNQRKSIMEKYGFNTIIQTRWSKYIEDDTITDAKYLHTIWAQFDVKSEKIQIFKNLKNIIKSIDNGYVKPISKVDSKKFYEHISTYFPPRDKILLTWVAWDPTLSNLELLSSGRYEPRHTSVEFWIGGWQIEGGTYGWGKSYSMSCISYVDGGPNYIVTIHTKDWKQFFHHLDHHLKIFQKLIEGPNSPKHIQCAFDVELQNRFFQFISESAQKDEYNLYQLGIFESPNVQPPSKL